MMEELKQNTHQKTNKQKSIPNLRQQKLNFTEVDNQYIKTRGQNFFETSREISKNDSINKENVLFKKPVINQSNNPLFQLPKLKYTSNIKTQDTGKYRMVHSLVQANIYNEQIQSFLSTKQKRTSELEEFTPKQKKGPRISGSVKAKQQKLSFISRLQTIRQSGTKLEKSTNFILNKAKNASNFIGKKYRGLSRNSRTILSGVEDYHLDEEAQKKYKTQVREMWMKYDR